MIEENPLGAAIFLGAFFVFFVSFILGVFEAVGIWRLSPLAFRLGLRVLTEQRSFPFPHFANAGGHRFETQTGKYRFTERSECLFRMKSRTFGRKGSTTFVLPFEQRIVTPFAIKGVIRWRNGNTIVTGRIPLFTTISIVAWLAAWSVPAVLLIEANEDVIAGVAFLFVGWSAAVGMSAFSIPFELRRAHRVLQELERHLLSTAA